MTVAYRPKRKKTGAPIKDRGPEALNAATEPPEIRRVGCRESLPETLNERSQMSWITRLFARRPLASALPNPSAQKPAILTLNDPDCDIDAVAAFLRLPADEQMRQINERREGPNP